MNKYANYSATVSTSVCTSMLLIALANYYQNKMQPVTLERRIKQFLKNDSLSGSATFTNAEIPGYFTQNCKKNAAEKYFSFYNEYPDFKKSDLFFTKVDYLFSNPENQSKIYFSKDSVKVCTIYRNINFSINYDYGYDDSLFIVKDDGNSMSIKECTINNIPKTLESYFDLSERIETAA